MRECFPLLIYFNMKVQLLGLFISDLSIQICVIVHTQYKIHQIIISRAPLQLFSTHSIARHTRPERH